MRVAIRLNREPYLPEAFAYRDYLIPRGHDVALLAPTDAPVAVDIEIRFMGLHAAWQDASPARAVVHEYNSLSMAPMPRIKNWLKRVINRRPSGRIFLSVRPGTL